ncbi:MAG: hypothetical protein IT334_02340 [Thermomicrobiales bacterium]|nr:hypothetical protein [Thermomicrobiales bacterium]
MPNRNPAPRSTRRPDPQSAAADVAAIFERRLLARGIRPDDFLDWRGSADLPPIPAVTPIRFGRGATDSPIEPLASKPTDSEPS